VKKGIALPTNSATPFVTRFREDTKMKRLVIGDIHGCYDELQELLDKAALSSADEIISVGDIVDRGPEPSRVFEFFMTPPNVRVVMGNHERKHVRSSRGDLPPSLSQIITRRQFGNDHAYANAVGVMARFPLVLEIPEAIIVHGYFEPGVALENQRANVITGTMSGEAYLKNRLHGPWYEAYDGTKPIIVGHRDYLANGKPLIYLDRVFGIDTTCYCGRALTGIILPDFRIISVKSRKDYWKETRNKFRARGNLL
jgi:serine/threonine protein phosphatase 1